MVKKFWLILLIPLLFGIGVMSAGGWLLLTRSGALWLLEQLDQRSSLKIASRELRGSLLGGLELRELQVDWPQGRARADRLQLNWDPAALLQRRLKLELLQVGSLDLQLTRVEKTPPKISATDASLLVPDLKPWFTVFGGWSIKLRKLQIDALQLVRPDGSTTRLLQIAGRLDCNAQRLKVDELQFAGDWGRWRGALQLRGTEPLLSGQLDWQPPQPFGPLETLDARLSLQRTVAGSLVGPITIRGHKADGSGYRLAGDLQLGRDGLQLQRLQLDHGSQDGGLVRGDLTLDWSAQLAWQTALELEALNLEAELGRATKIGGKLALKGTQTSYKGHVDLHNSAVGWELLGLRGELEGDTGRLKFKQLQGRLLGGNLAGEFDLDWRAGIASSFRLVGTELLPALIPSGPKGKLDLQLDGWLKKTPGSDLQLGGTALITRGVLLQRDFRGEVRGTWRGGRRLQIENLDLHGAWGELKAEGDLQRRLELGLELRDAAALWPPLKGAGRLAGWLAWTADWPHGELTAQLRHLAYRDWAVGELAFSGQQPTAGGGADLQLKLDRLQRGEVGVEAVTLKAQGLPGAHQAQLRVSEGGNLAEMELKGGLQDGLWQGSVYPLSLIAPQIESFRLQQPVSLNIGPHRVGVSEILLQGDNGGRLRLAGDWDRQTGGRQLTGSWQHFNLSWLKLWLAKVQFDGESSGHGAFVQDAAGEVTAELQAEYVGLFDYAGQSLQLDKAGITGRWGKQGLTIAAEVLERNGGKLTLAASSSQEAGLSLQQPGELTLELREFPLRLLSFKMPSGSELDGRLAVKIGGHWLGTDRFTLAGKLKVVHGSFSYVDAQSRLNLPVENAGFDFTWQQDRLQADLNLELGAGDGLAGEIDLNLPARWPLDLAQPVPLSGALRFQLGRLGAFSLLVPEQLAGLGGEIGGALRLGGSLRQPEFSGDLHLADGRLQLAQLGIELDRIAVQANFRPQQLTFNQVEIHSGAGQLNGRGEVYFNGWSPERIRVELKGEDFLLVNLPELRAIASPDLQLVGSLADLTLGGMLKIPELQINNWHPTGRVVHSDDLVYVDQLPKPETAQPLKFKLDLGIELGDRVVVKDRGLDVRLAGSFHLNMATQGEIFARGQIDVPVGNYTAYGVKLPITSGRLYFNGGPVDNPALDIVALKKQNGVSAGVAVGGTARQPEIRLISEPMLDDTDILSYIVLGRSSTGGAGDLSALSLAASALLSAGDSASLQQKLQNKSGIDVINVSTGETGTLETSMVTVGKYLTPELYLSYGRALTTSANQVQLRYRPSERVDIESQLGEVSGADIYYRIEFE